MMSRSLPSFLLTTLLSLVSLSEPALAAQIAASPTEPRTASASVADALPRGWQAMYRHRLVQKLRDIATGTATGLAVGVCINTFAPSYSSYVLPLGAAAFAAYRSATLRPENRRLKALASMAQPLTQEEKVNALMQTSSAASTYYADLGKEAQELILGGLPAVGHQYPDATMHNMKVALLASCPGRSPEHPHDRVYLNEQILREYPYGLHRVATIHEMVHHWQTQQPDKMALEQPEREHEADRCALVLCACSECAREYGSVMGSEYQVSLGYCSKQECHNIEAAHHRAGDLCAYHRIPWQQKMIASLAQQA